MTRLSTFLIVLISLFVAIVGREEAHSLSNHEKEIPADILFEIEKRIDQLLSEKERNSDESLNRRRPKPSRLQSDYDDDEELPKRPTETKKTQSSCSSFFQTSENQIVRTKDSLENGAQFIEKYDITPDHPDQVLRVTCMQKCCETNSCDFALFAEKDLKSCYLFNCAGKCLFLDHVGYVSMYMNISQHEDELLGIGHRVSSTTSTTTTISTVTASPAAAPLGDDSTDDKDDVNKAKGKAPKPDPDTPHQVAIPGDPKARIDGHVAAPNGTGTSGIGGVIVHHVSDDGSISESEVVEISVSDNFWKAHYSRAALMALILGLILTLTMFVFITIRIVSSRRRMHLRKGRMTNGNEADYLINGMYL